MKRGNTTRGRARSERAKLAPPSARPLLRALDQGDPVEIPAGAVGQAGDRWIGPFLDANGPMLRRLDLRPEVRGERGVRLLLHPGSRIGAIPLLSPATRKVTAGLLVSPRFRWAALGAVFQRTGFAVEPVLGGALAVPGSAREVPPWILAAPVLRRLATLLEHERRGFVERREERASPRGRIDWSVWATQHVPSGRWDRFPCVFPDPQFDPSVRAQVRWTLRRLRIELGTVSDSLVGRALLDRAAELEARVGEGEAQRPRVGAPGLEGAFLAEAMEAMGWVAEERGLGGARALDGLAWDLAVDQLWEAWVSAFVADLAPRLGMTSRGTGQTRHSFNWQGPVRSMGSLAPDAVLHGLGKTIWVDAKYKAHLALLVRKGWQGFEGAARDAHRADLHQALAYASLARTDIVDTILVYPDLSPTGARPSMAIATLPAGPRRVRLLLAALPFGFGSPSLRERALEDWRGALSDGEQG